MMKNEQNPLTNKLTKAFFTVWLLLVFAYADAQQSCIHAYVRDTAVSCANELGKKLLYPFAGGLNNCQMANIDINLDGKDDILVFDRHGNRLLPFVYPNKTSHTLRFAPEYTQYFPRLEQWMNCVDYNNDGKKDIFTYTTGGIKVYKNVSTATKLAFKQITNPYLLSLQGAVRTNILVTYADYPAIADIDNDGDYDILTFWGLGSFVEWHRNMSKEKYGHADSLVFEKQASCWGRFAESPESNVIKLDTCVAGGKSLLKAGADETKHTGSTLLVTDENGDGLPDLTLGDVDYNSLVHLTNGGTLQQAKITAQTTAYPNLAHPIALNSFPCVMLCDVDDDGMKDLVVSPFEPSLTKAENSNSVLWYKNTGSNVKPLFAGTPQSFLQNEMLDFGSGAYPVFFDYNNDGLTDILVGNYGAADSCNYSVVFGLKCYFSSRIALLLNTGTLQKPAFKLADQDIAQLSRLNMQSLIPALGDMDGDGDMDMVCGNSKGGLMYCENTALPGQGAHFQLKNTSWLNMNTGDFSSPDIVDVDNDGLLDLVVGKRDGALSFYKNTGTKFVPQFALVSQHFGSVNVTQTDVSNYGYAVPRMYKDKLGALKMFVASESGGIFVYDKIDNNLQGAFNFLGILPKVSDGWRTGVALGNLNNDTLTDMAVGNYAGGLSIFMGKPDNMFTPEPEQPKCTLTVIPNPTRTFAVLTLCDEWAATATRLRVYAVNGCLINSFDTVVFPFSINVSAYPPGVYLIVLQTTKGILHAKLVVG